MAQQTTVEPQTSSEFENQHYMIVRCRSDDYSEKEVVQRGYSFRPAAIDVAFDRSHGDDPYDYWVEEDDLELL